MRRRGRQKIRDGFAASEMVVAILVVVILFVAASPLHRAAREEAARLRCNAARQVIADAQRAFQSRSPDGRFARTLQELSSVLPNPPRCPHGGRFRFKLGLPGARGSRRMAVTCSAEGHRPVIFAPADPPHRGPSLE